MQTLYAWAADAAHNTSAPIEGVRISVDTQETMLHAAAPYATSSPEIAMAADGSHAVVWITRNQNRTTPGVFGRRFGAGGTPVGAEFQVTSDSTVRQAQPCMAMAPGGAFVVAWEAQDLDGIPFSVSARRFLANGAPADTDFLVSDPLAANSQHPSAGMRADKSFAIAWDGNVPGSTDGVLFRLFSADGVAAAPPVRANTHPEQTVYRPSLSFAPDGGFVLVWEGLAATGSLDPSMRGVSARCFDASGTPRSAEFLVNQRTAGDQRQPRVAVDGSGGFVVVWTDNGRHQNAYGDSTISAIMGRRFDAQCSPVGDEFQLNRFVLGDPDLGPGPADPRIAMFPSGAFAVGFTGFTVAGGTLTSTAMIRRFNSDGTPMEVTQFRSHWSTANSHAIPVLAGLSETQFSVAWYEVLQPDLMGAVFGRSWGP